MQFVAAEISACEASWMLTKARVKNSNLSHVYAQILELGEVADSLDVIFEEISFHITTNDVHAGHIGIDIINSPSISNRHIQIVAWSCASRQDEPNHPDIQSL